MVRVITTLDELINYLRWKRWFQPEWRLLMMLLKTKKPFNRRRYAKALMKKLRRKGVILIGQVIEDLLNPNVR